MIMTILLLVVLALGSGAVVTFNRLLRADEDSRSEPELGPGLARTANAEVVSVLRAGNRTFLQVRYRAGTSMIQTDVLYPASLEVPLVGRRVPVRYDPGAPARVVYAGTGPGKTLARA